MDTEAKLIEKIDCKVSKKSVRIGNYNINYVVAGKGKPVVLIHGADFGWGQWYKILPSLSQKYKVFALDLPGCGKSTGISFSSIDVSNEFLRTTCQFINRLGLSDVILVGHSIGGWVSLSANIILPERVNHTVLVNPLGFSDEVPMMYKPTSFYPIALLLSKTVAKPNRRFVESFLRSAVVDKESIDDIIIDYYLANLRKSGSHPLLLMSQISGFNRVNKRFLFSKKDLHLITNPVSIIVGQKDPITNFKTIREKVCNIENFDAIFMKDVSHIPFVDKPEKFLEYFGELLQQKS